MILEYQLYDFVEGHNIIYTDEGDEIQGDYIIHSFGRTLDDKSVYAKITGYEPRFYIELPTEWEQLDGKEIKKKLKILKEYLIGKENKKIYYQYKKNLTDIKLTRKKKAEGFNNDREFNFACLLFNNSEGMKKFTYFFEKNEIYIYGLTKNAHKYRLYESNVLPMLRCFHSRNISGCSWVSASNYKLIKKENDKESTCDIEINVDYTNLEPIIKDVNAPFRIASFDIECYSHDGGFPQASRIKDEIIQIGISYTKLGSSEPYRKWIACLDKTDPIEGVEVVSCESEQEVIEQWINELITHDSDILTGYNTFYFDEKYIYDRCEQHLKMKSDVGCISKLKNKICNFKEIKLASSALGENLLRIWDTPGRVHIDLMKDIQKTFNLTCYKLDYVASNFIRGEVKSFKKLEDENYELTCVSVEDIQENDYIHLEVIKGFVSDEVGDKYLVSKIERDNNILIVKSKDNLDTELEIAKHGGKIFWSQGKDDVGPKEIFKMQKQGSKERAIVAKYCIKDCSLVNLLVNKLEVVTKNLEMSNVCFVPLSYLFTRGQGIKLFSLCSKEFKEKNYLFPVIKAKKDSEGNIEKEESYEGAIVFDPVPKIDYEALCTKDYMSLYPSAIMHKNMSHETIVEDPLYDNLEGITYYNAIYKENDGTNKYVRYAKKDNQLGVIPSILDKLLKERKNVKKLMKTEKNPFKYKILDAKQLAVKITANSLYGQLGATTSPVAKRDIAACTTSTGREMLLFAKKYDEELLPWILNGLKDAYLNNDIKRVNKIFDWELKARHDQELINKIEKYTKETIVNFTSQPVVRYGDTDSAFTCFRFRENTELVLEEESIELFQKIIKFGEELIKPFLRNKNKKLFSELYNTYYGNINKLELPEPHYCEPEPSDDKIKLPIEDRMNQFLKEYMYENYFAWLWTLQEIVIADYNNYDVKLFDSASYLLLKYKIEYNDLRDIRKEEVIVPLVNKLESYFIDSWFVPSDEFINDYIELIQTTFPNEDLSKLNLKKLTKDFLTITMKEDWIKATKEDWIKATKEKKNLKRERKYNEKTLTELVMKFIENNLKLNFEFYKNEHINKVVNFVNNTLKDYWLQPWWDVVDGKKVHKLKIFKGGSIIQDKRTLEYSIELGEISGELVKSRLPFPHDLEYEKTFWPFMILTKKRYVGNKYEFNPNKYKQDFMGIVLKRRDNAPIVKEICSGIIDYLINKRDPEGAKKFTEECLENMFTGKYDIKYFLQSRTLKLKESYADWTKIAHVYLAEQIALRDPGNKPQSGDRIEFAVVEVPIDPEQPNKKLLQGEMIEIPSYIKQNNIPINYMFYMKNQIMNPALQFLKLVDKNAEDIFTKFEMKYGNIKPKKEKKPKVEKPKVEKAKKPTKKSIKLNTEPVSIMDTESSDESKKSKDTKNVKKSKDTKNVKKSKKIKIETKEEENQLEETKLEETKLEETKLEETKLEETKLEETKLEETKLEETVKSKNKKKIKDVISSSSEEEINNLGNNKKKKLKVKNIDI
jgi:DNA polymerase elongation subunit (family B)